MCLIVEVVLQQDTCNSNDLNALQRRIFNIADPLFALFARFLPLSVRFASLELGWEVKKDKLGQNGKSAGNSGPGRFLSPCNGCGMRGEAERNSQKIFSDKRGLLKHIPTATCVPFEVVTVLIIK